MEEGTSLLGGYACDDWSRDIASNITTIQNVSNAGVKFPSGITEDTWLEGFRILSFAATTPGTVSSVTVTDRTTWAVRVVGGPVHLVE